MPFHTTRRTNFMPAALLIATVWITFAPTARAADDLLAMLRKTHPRLLVLDADLDAARSAAAKHPVAKLIYQGYQKEAQKMLDQPPAEHKLKGIRMLSVSRMVLVRIQILGTLYRLDGDRKYAERARKELLTVVAMPDWNPPHFLDTAEMTAAVALGYDWFYDFLSPEDRSTLRRGMVELGLKPGLKAYKAGVGWSKSSHNWAQVCAGGMLMGALAIADEEPELARELIPLTRTSIERAMKTFAPDGGWPEGPGYWAYATQFNVYYLAALETALGTDLGLAAMPGFSETGNFRIQSIGPISKSFNFADAGENVAPASQMYWLARHFDRPEYAAAERTQFPSSGDGMGLLWFAGRGSIDKLPLDAVFHGVDVAFFRSASTDPKAWFVGFKGGDNKANHSHLDLGTFVLDALGQRWACDLGGDNYDLPNYFGKNRWTYYRLRTEAHNTLTIDNENQPTAARARIVAYHSSPDWAFAVADLAQAYPRATRAQRGIALLNRDSVLVQDEITSKEDLPVTWSMQTRATVKLSEAGDVATLSQGDASINLSILEPKGAKFEAIEPRVDPPQTPLKGVTKLVLKPNPAKEARIAVFFTGTENAKAPILEPLAKWIDAAPVK